MVGPDDQLSLAIGREGQNARLTARLTGFKIDIKSETQAIESGELDEFQEEYYGQGYDEEDASYEDGYYEEGYAPEDAYYEDGEYVQEGEYQPQGEYQSEGDYVPQEDYAPQGENYQEEYVPKEKK